MISVQQISGQYRFVSVGEVVVLGRAAAAVGMLIAGASHGLTFDESAAGSTSAVVVSGDVIEARSLATAVDATSAYEYLNNDAVRPVQLDEVATGETHHAILSSSSEEDVILGSSLSIISGDHSQEEAQASTALVIHEVAEGQVPDVDGAAAETIALARTSDGESVLAAEDSAATLALDIASETAVGVSVLPPAVVATASESITLGRDQSTTVQDQDQEDTQASRALGRTETAVGTAEHLNAAASESRTLGRSSAGSVVAIPDVSRTATRVLTRSEWGFGSASAATPVSRAVVETRTLGKQAEGSSHIPADITIQVTYQPVSVATFNNFYMNPNGTSPMEVRASFGQVYSSRDVLMIQDPPVGADFDAWTNAETVDWGTTGSTGWSLLQIRLRFGSSWVTVTLNPASIPAGRHVSSLPGQIRIVKPPL